MFNLFKNNPATSYTNVSAAEFKQLQEDKNALVLDVRTAGEVAGGKIKEARNIDMLSGSFDKQLQELDKSKTYLLYCRNGNRSAQAASKMASMGFDKVYNLKGGIASWPYEQTR
ncbi:rhodanese-like domain-containing protein [Rhodocytophaga aerolata]|uniref:Rhodanese-like domain-containing protein n=1 Tax=Rhodocytophaga aerolata TaxID=455078 RepID=A0ABT8RAN7_9BACT|nr:rhodanese-like domain-containing protein [Rhodocytophaga aerolata]MDO1448389.1 rhodanese-like domain-containing protein [Rhodocytophaga aerolata]